VELEKMRDEAGNEAPASLPNIGVTIALFCYFYSNVHFTAGAVKRVKLNFLRYL